MILVITQFGGHVRLEEHKEIYQRGSCKIHTKRNNHYHLLYALAVKYAKAHECKAFWIAADCQPSRRSEATDDEHFQRLTNEDVSHEAERDWRPATAVLFQNSNIQQVYTMSDIIREAYRTIVITLGPHEAHPTVAVKEWGERVWTLPEILLGKSHEITLLQCGIREVKIDVKEGIFSKIQLFHIIILISSINGITKQCGSF